MNDDIRAKAGPALGIGALPRCASGDVDQSPYRVPYGRRERGQEHHRICTGCGVSNTVMVNELIRLSSRLVNDQPDPDLLERRHDPHDPRIMAVNLTEKGRALLTRALAAVED